MEVIELKKEGLRRNEFNRCPNFVKGKKCGGIFFHGDTQSECIKCGLVLMEKCCYNIEKKQIKLVRKDDKRIVAQRVRKKRN
jgi:hypothetical protein